MYYPVGLPKRLRIPGGDHGRVKAIVCNRDRILFAVLTEKSIWIWFSRPCVPVVLHRRSDQSLETAGTNQLLEWRPDSSMIVVATNKNRLIFYSVVVDESRREVYEQRDPPNPTLKRESAELYSCESIPPLMFSTAFEREVIGGVTGLVCLRDELMVATGSGHIQRLRWDGDLNNDYCVDLRRVPFCDDQLVMKAVPLDEPGIHVVDLEYSPLVGGFAVVLSDGRAAFLTASTLKFDPNAVQGIWARDLDDATCAAINHKYRLLAYGRANSQGVVYMVDEATGGLEVSHRLVLSDRDYGGSPGPVGFMKWTPDGTVLGMSWCGGGVSLWSVFGSLLTVSLHWDYTDNPLSKPITITNMEWGAEGYELWCLQHLEETATDKAKEENQGEKNNNPREPKERGAEKTVTEDHISTSVLQFSFIKSALTVNPCMSRLVRVLLQGSDRLYLNTSEGLTSSGSCPGLPQDSLSLYFDDDEEGAFEDPSTQPLQGDAAQFTVAANKQWIVIPIPHNYTASNWPIRYTCVDEEGLVVGVAGRNGVAHYSLRLRRWHLFGNESQERDFVVTGGLLWWRAAWLVLGAYNIPGNTDELRLYPREQKLDNLFATTIPQPAQVLLLNIYYDQLIVLTADCHITVYNLQPSETNSGGGNVSVTKVQEVDISGLTVHPACVVSVLLTSLRTESSWPTHTNPHTMSPNANTRSSPWSPNANTRPSPWSPNANSRPSWSTNVHNRSSPWSPTANTTPSPWSSTSSNNHWSSAAATTTNHRAPMPAQSVIINISGKVLMIQRDQHHAPGTSGNGKLFHSAQMTPIVLASSCEALWCSSSAVSHKPHLSHALWLHCGVHGTRAWLPLFPNAADKSHTFMARRIMLPFTPSIYPLAVMFEEGILLGAETDTSLLACDAASHHQPLTVVERTSQVYLHQVLRQLLRRNLGYHAWEVANTCRDLPYFPHALELLLHQVLEEEASSKDPLPDCLLPRVVEFIAEFPVYLQTVVQCARKTELALWRYLFSAAGSPKTLFIRALEDAQLDTAASYLIILQNLESATVSRSLATRLLNATLEAGKWDLSKDLIRFLRSIDPMDLDSPKSSVQSCGSTKIGFTHATPPVSPACADEDLSMILPNTQVLRGRSFSSASGPKVSPVLGGVGVGGVGSESGGSGGVGSGGGSTLTAHQSVLRSTSDSAKILPEITRTAHHATVRKRSSSSLSREVSTAEEFFLDVILQRHAKKLLVGCRLRDLGTMAAHLDFPLVSWLRRERCRAARVDDFVASLKQVHRDFSWPYPSVPTSHIRRYSVSSVRSVLVEERMQGLSIAVPKVTGLGSGGEIGDSGYLSHATTGDTTVTPQHAPHSPTTPPPPTTPSDLTPHQALLLPHSPRAGDTMSVMSEEGTVYGEDTSSLCGDWNIDGAGDPTRDLLSRPPDPPPQPTPRPPPHAEVQLRYLLQVVLEAGCLEWSVVLAVVLRDALAVLRVVTLARAPDVPARVIHSLTHGLQDLLYFTNTECLGYQNFLSAIMGQVKVLERVASTRAASRTPSPPSSRPPSTSRDSSDLPTNAEPKTVQTTQPQQQQPSQEQDEHVEQQQQQSAPISNSRVPLIPRTAPTPGDTLAEETPSQASESDPIVEEEEEAATGKSGSAACVIS